MLKITTNPNLKMHFRDEDVAASFAKLLARKDLGFLNLPNDQESLAKSSALGSQISANYEHLVLVGIGGSSMGPRALAEISGSTKISFLDNVDSMETEAVIANLKNLSKTAWLFISKSGTTIEVLWTLELAEQIYRQHNTEFFPHTFYITEDTDNTLNNLAKKHQRPRLAIPLDVGGRFSVLSPVGLVIAQYLDRSPKLLLEGAREALQARELLITSVNQYLSSFERNEVITLFWFYSSRMRWFGCWLQQLWAESLGKKETIDGKTAPHFSSPMISIGTCDQHSILQQIMEGPKNKFVNIFRFLDVEKSKHKIKTTQFAETKLLENLNFGELIKAEAVATEMALQSTALSTTSFELIDHGDKSLGFLFMFYQLLVATIGEHTRINAFNQPSVALSKKLTLELLKKLKPKL
ncbi:MAG: glucose-6-phosphate isomerase [Bdellovibrio sp.]|nr:glucose-6-phosphate isomerase [Bdellovibrio sp.]